ncbi:GNAT family N-acetyltransferase [Leucobacter chromiireducens]|uniref:GNAT family N-acetyltransferase n=1 Tax=Leucobacter chromiireducens subsp. chromiireducens TaxID=660067 RepID=A0ABS1SMM5_9MICO|nr:GNAT family N-acetyltransferase [Leucobacter chromiireducens]MBL3689422.1 GNAT family N-acetyltransferase [Leucobacter chromiireducens subsp. chromiireducens]
MSRFAESVHEYWREALAGDERHRSANLSLTLAPELDEDERVTVLHTVADAHTAVAVSPDVAAVLEDGGVRAAAAGEAALREALVDAGITLHGADYLFYLPLTAAAALRSEPDAAHVRRLDPERTADVEAFAEFEEAAGPEDLDAGQVDLDDWAVYGAFDEGGRLLSVASAYPWGDSVLADFGVITLPTGRGRGHARALTRALARVAAAEGLELQYRCQLDNEASAGLARSAGLELFGRWEIPTPEESDDE